MPNAILGLDCKVYRLTTGTRASWDGSTDTVVSGTKPSNLSEVTNVVEVTQPASSSEADASTRDSKFKKVLAALIDLNPTINMIWDKTNTHIAALIAAKFSGDDVALALLDGDEDTSGSEGFWCDFQVMSFERGEPLEGAATINFNLRPSGKSSVNPQWVTVTT